MTTRAQEFADRLLELESSGEVEDFVSTVFAPDAELIRPETGHQLHGPDGAVRFWQEYLDQFTEVHSTFSRIADGEVGVLEWSSAAQLRNGTDITYTGVSLLDFDEDGKVRRFSTYYDTRVFQPRPH